MVHNKKVSILNINFDNLTKTEVIKIICGNIHSKHRTFVVTANPEICYYASRHQDYFNAISKADMVIPDGIGVVIASKIKRNPLAERVPGFDILTDLLHYSNQNNLKIYIIGSKKKQLEAACKNIKHDYPNLSIVGHFHGYMNSDENEQILNEIQTLKPDIIFVAMGYPKQEFWISSHIDNFEHGIFIGVGGSIDVLSGMINRAPAIWQKLNLEWLYRLFKQPTRWRRTLKLFKFIFKVLSPDYLFKDTKIKKSTFNNSGQSPEEDIEKLSA